MHLQRTSYPMRCDATNIVLNHRTIHIHINTIVYILLTITNAIAYLYDYEWGVALDTILGINFNLPLGGGMGGMILFS